MPLVRWNHQLPVAARAAAFRLVIPAAIAVLRMLSKFASVWHRRQDEAGRCMKALYTTHGLKSSIGRFLKERWPYRHKICVSQSQLEAFAEQCGAKRFHSRAIRQRIWRRHVCIACSWIVDYLPNDVSVFEPGCGCGSNLLWLALRGFHNISGTDIDRTALNLCYALQKKFALSFQVFEDDCMLPKHPTLQHDVILSVNWLYHIPNASLDIFLENYLPCLKSNGIIIFDMIDSAYNNVKNNQYHSEDSKKLQHERRPSEYTFRMSNQDVAESVSKHGLHIVRHAKIYAVPQRNVYILSR